jgi:hypothetical protein
MSLSHLAAVELQLCMHFLDKVSLLYLARCSRFLLHCASTDFAWRFQPMLQLTLSPSLADVGSRLRRSLLRFCDIRLVWMPDVDKEPVSDAEIVAVAEVPRLRSLNAIRRVDFNSDVAARLWQLMQRDCLKTLHLRNRTNASFDLSSLVTAQSALSTLSLAVTVFERKDYLLPLSNLQCLTNLSVNADLAGGEDMLSALASCMHLSRLYIIHAKSTHISALLSRSSMSSLRKLHIVNGKFSLEDSVESWKAAFGNLTNLESLNIKSCFAFGVRRLLEVVGSLPLNSLRHLTVGGQIGWVQLLVLHGPGLESLHSLTLVAFYGELTGVEAAITQLMLQLHTLTLKCCSNVDAVLAALRTTQTTLSEIHVDLSKFNPQRGYVVGEFLPSVSVVQSLLLRMPSLKSVSLQMPNSTRMGEPSAQAWLSDKLQFVALRDASAGRFKLMGADESC